MNDRIQEAIAELTHVESSLRLIGTMLRNTSDDQGSITAKEYTDQAMRSFKNCGLSAHALGLTGEAGEVADMVKKGVFHEHGMDYDKLVLELGDVLWYVTALALTSGFSLEDVMRMNIIKLQKRYPNDRNVEDSKIKRDEQ